MLHLYRQPLQSSFLSGKHVSHLESASDDDLDRLLSIVVDVENLFICVHREEDPDTKQVSVRVCVAWLPRQLKVLQRE